MEEHNEIQDIINDTYVELSFISANMGVQVRGRAPGDYRITLVDFKKRMSLLYSLTNGLIPESKVKFAAWETDNGLTSKDYALDSIKMFNVYVAELIKFNIIKIKKDLR